MMTRLASAPRGRGSREAPRRGIGAMLVAWYFALLVTSVDGVVGRGHRAIFTSRGTWRRGQSGGGLVM